MSMISPFTSVATGLCAASPPPDAPQPPVSRALATGPEPAEPESFFSRLALATVPGWLFLPPVDYQNRVAHGLLEASWAAFVAHLSYSPENHRCRLLVRLDGVLWTPVLASSISRLVARIPLVKVTPDPEIRAAMVEAVTLAWDNSPADQTLRSLVEAVRNLLDDRMLWDMLNRKG